MIDRFRATLIALPLATAALLGSTAATPATSLTCQGHGVDPTAQLHHETQIVIKAPLNVVWRLHTHVEGWPAWQHAVATMKRLDPGPLRPGSRFQWTMPVPATVSTPATTLVITSTVQQVKPGQCIRWEGPAIGTGLRIDRGTHVWNFIKVPGGTLVRTEESWTGQQIESNPAEAARNLYPGLDAWLADLKAAAEAARC